MKLKPVDVIAILTEALAIEDERLTSSRGTAQSNPAVYEKWRKRRAAFAASIQWLTDPDVMKSIKGESVETDFLKKDDAKEKLVSLKQHKEAHPASAIPVRGSGQAAPPTHGRKVLASEVEIPRQTPKAPTTPIIARDPGHKSDSDENFDKA